MGKAARTHRSTRATTDERARAAVLGHHPRLQHPPRRPGGDGPVRPRADVRGLGADPRRRLLEGRAGPNPSAWGCGRGLAGQADRADRRTATSWSRPTTEWTPRGASSSRCSTTTTSSRRRALEHMAKAIAHEPDVDYLYSDEDKIDPDGEHLRRLPQGGLVAGAAARTHVHLSLLGAARLGGARRRRLPRGVRGVAGPRPRAAGHRAGPQGRAHPEDPLPLAGDPGLGGRRPARQAVRLGGRRQSRPGPPGPDRHRRDRGLRPRAQHLSDRRASSIRRCGSAWSSRPAAPTAWFGASAATTSSRRCAACWSRAVTTTSRSSWSTTPAPLPGRSTSCTSVAPRQLRLVPYDRPFDFSEKCNLGVLAAQGEVVVLLNDDIEIVSEDFLVQLVAPLFEDGVGMTGGSAALSRRPHPAAPGWPSTSGSSTCWSRAGRSPAVRSWSVSPRATASAAPL